MKNVKKYSQRLGAGDLYPLFTCMLTARSWDSVNRGIGQTPVTATEVGAPPPPPRSCPVPDARGRARRGVWSPANPGSGVLYWWCCGDGVGAELERYWLRRREGGRKSVPGWTEGKGTLSHCVPPGLINLEYK